MKNKITSFINFLEDYYTSSYRGILHKEKKEIDDFFMIITFSEMMGIPNPYEFYTAEIMVDLMPKFHEWHKKAGLDKSPFDNFPCVCC